MKAYKHHSHSVVVDSFEFTVEALAAEQPKQAYTAPSAIVASCGSSLRSFIVVNGVRLSAVCWSRYLSLAVLQRRPHKVEREM